MHIAAKPDGERAKAKNQPPKVPKIQKIQSLGGLSIGAVSIRSKT